MSMREARMRLKKYQEKTFPHRSLSESFEGFDLRAYPETAKWFDLERIGAAIKVYRAEDEGIEDYRSRILEVLETPDNEEAA